MCVDLQRPAAAESVLQRMAVRLVNALSTRVEIGAGSRSGPMSVGHMDAPIVGVEAVSNLCAGYAGSSNKAEKAWSILTTSWLV